jgi:26S proteasome regulatory subunit N1
VLGCCSLLVVDTGSADGDVVSMLAFRLMEASPAELDVPLTRLLALSVGLLFIGRGDESDGTMALLDTVTHDMGKFAKIILQGCAFAGTGDVLTVQKMLHICSEHPQGEEEKKKEEDAATATSAGGAAAAAAAAASTATPATAESKASKFLYQVRCVCVRGV